LALVVRVAMRPLQQVEAKEPPRYFHPSLLLVAGLEQNAHQVAVMAVLAVAAEGLARIQVAPGFLGKDLLAVMEEPALEVAVAVAQALSAWRPPQ
jgi:hypothetical protein